MMMLTYSNFSVLGPSTEKLCMGIESRMVDYTVNVQLPILLATCGTTMAYIKLSATLRNKFQNLKHTDVSDSIYNKKVLKLKYLCMKLKRKLAKPHTVYLASHTLPCMHLRVYFYSCTIENVGLSHST